jgi:hypothetical protein
MQASQPRVPTLHAASPDAIERMDDYANTIVLSFTGEIEHFGYNAASVRFMAGVIDQHRATYTEAAGAKISELYGAFLCKALIAELPDAGHTWVETADGDTGIVLSNGSTSEIVLPAAAIARHIAQGPEASTYDYFMAMRELFRSKAL